MSVSQEAASWVAGLRFADLPPEVRSLAKRAFLDTIGVILAGADEPSARAVSALVAEDGGSPAAAALGTGLRTTMESAALVNGTAGHALDYDDVSLSAVAHPSVVILPAVLAAAEAARASGQAAVTAYVAGTELLTRLGRVMGYAHYRAGWHATVTLGTLGAAAAAGKVLGLPGDQIAHALGIAVSMAGGTRRNFGTLTKPFHAGHAARCGVEAARLARAGLTSDPLALEGEGGFFSLFAQGEGDPASLLPQLGSPFDILDPGFPVKLYPCCYQTHRAADAALAMSREAAAGQIERVEVAVPEGGLTALIHRAPVTGLEAKFSMEFVVAAALLDGRLLLSTFADAAVTRPEVQSLLPRIAVTEDPGIPYLRDPMSEGWVEVRVALHGGRLLSRRVAHASGSPRAPAAPDRLLAKFRDCASRLGPERTEQAIALLMALDEQPGLEELVRVVTP